MKASSETLSPTRVKLTVEVPFDELRPSLDAAYKKLAGQVKIQGFRPGKVPPRILDQRLGRATILDEALQDALPRFYGAAVEENEVDVLGRPSVDVTTFADGEPLVFTAEVDVRPEVTLPDYEGLPVTVDAVEVTQEQVDEQLDSLRDRFAVLEGVERPVADGDYVSIDLVATAGGDPVPEASTAGLSYQVGSGTLVDGLDEALVGLADGATATFTTQLVAGEHAGEPADVEVTVRSVKEKALPALDDEFATTASDVDTIDELRADIRTRLERVARMQQGLQARDRALEALLAKIDVPVPDSVVEGEVEARMHNIGHQLEAADLTLEGYLTSEGKSREEFDAEMREGSLGSVKASFVLDAVARKEELGVTEAELTEQVVRRAQRAGMDPQAFADGLVRNGQLQALMGEIVRGKALATVLDTATVTDSEGAPVNLDELREDTVEPGAGAEPEQATDEPAEATDEPELAAAIDAEAAAETEAAGGDEDPAGA